MPIDIVIPNTRRFLSADALIKSLRNRFERVPDPRRQNSVVYPMADCLMAAFAMFSLKDPSLLAFERRSQDEGIRQLYKIKSVPSDSQMREILDGIEIDQLNECFADIFFELQRGGVLKRFVFDEGYYLLAIDGTGYFCSSMIRCPHCLEHQRRGGQTQYVHQAVVATLVHPDYREVIPLAIEPIVKQDGSNKNDCERNAVRRLLHRVKKQHPMLKAIVVEDGLASNAPHIGDLQSLGFHYLLGAKPGDHKYLFYQVIEACDQNRVLTTTRRDVKSGQVVSETQYCEDLPLNASNDDLRVGFLQHFEYDPESGDVSKRFSWVTDLKLNAAKLHLYQRGGRSRWRIENETFNTLKNQGYNFEHNYGHGTQNLSTVLAVLMLLAFLVDQVQQACCPLFQAVLAKLGSRRELWDNLRSHFRHFVFTSFQQLWRAILTGSARNRPPPPNWA